MLDHSVQLHQSAFNAILFRPILPISRCRLLETATATGFFTAQGPIKNPWQPDGAGFVEQPLIGQHLPGKLYVWSRTSRLRSNRATGASAGQSAATPCPSLASRTTADAHAATSPETLPDPQADEVRPSKQTSFCAGVAPGPSEKCAQRTVASGQPHTAGLGAAPADALI